MGCGASGSNKQVGNDAPSQKANENANVELGEAVSKNVILLALRVISASGLRNADTYGKSDPYVVCRVGSKGSSWEKKGSEMENLEWRSRAVQNSLDLQWDLAFSLEIDMVETDSQLFLSLGAWELQARIYDKDELKTDDFLGQCLCQIPAVVDKTGEEVIPVTLKDGTAHGAVKVQYWSCSATADQKDALATEPPPSWVTYNELEKAPKVVNGDVRGGPNSESLWYSLCPSSGPLAVFRRLGQSCRDESYMIGLFQGLGENDFPWVQQTWYPSTASASDPMLGIGPGKTTVQYFSWEGSSAILKEFAPRIESGTMKRDNELGILTNLGSAAFPDFGRIALSFCNEDHAISRPWTVMVCDGAQRPEDDNSTKGWNRSSIRAFWKQRLAGVSTFDTDDIPWLVSILLHRILLDMDISEDDAKGVITMISSSLNQFVIATLQCPFLRHVMGTKSLRAKRQLHIERIKQAIRAKWPTLSKEPLDDRKLMLLGNAAIDMLLFAGGLSVPSLITYMLGVKFRANAPSCLESLDWSDENSIMDYFWEVARHYPPVWGVGMQTTDDGGKTWQHKQTNIGMAMSDPTKFPEPFEFKLGRPGLNHKDSSLSLLWAETAVVDDNVAHPNSHVCPGKNLSIAIILGFFQEFELAGPWHTDAPPTINQSGSPKIVLAKQTKQ